MKEKTLVIVESPKKAKSIGKYLGNDYIVLASFGLGFALAFGLGCKDMVAKSVTSFLDKVKK